MKNLKQLVLPCYKLEMAMSVEAWYFLHGSTDDRKTTDDYPFGGEAGMVLKCEPVFELVEKLQSERHYDEIIYTSPDGIRYDQHEANRLSTLENIIILCGHYKGIDHRIREHLVTREISIGD